MKECFPDRECNIRDNYEIRLGISRLAMLHGQLRQIQPREEWNMGSIFIESLEKEQERHVKEMKRARNFIRGKRGKTEFELCVMDSFDYFFEQAKEALNQMKGLFPENGAPEQLAAAELSVENAAENMENPVENMKNSARKQGNRLGYLCHGDLDQHHVLMGNGYTAIIEYNRMHLGVQAEDLYRLMRKVMEKHGWDGDLGITMLDSYERVRPMLLLMFSQMHERFRENIICLCIYISFITCTNMFLFIHNLYTAWTIHLKCYIIPSIIHNNYPPLSLV